MNVDKSKELVNRIIGDVGGAFTTGLSYIGDKLGLFQALARYEQCSSEELAVETNLNERYVREWLKGMVAAEYIEYNPETDTYFMSAEQKAVLTQEESPVFASGAFQFTISSLLHTPKLIESFRTGGGISFEEFGEEIASAIDRLHRPWFDHFLTSQWLPGVPGLKERLDEGISVLDVGCGLGRSTVAIGSDYPKSQVVGIDPHVPSIEKARKLASEKGINNVEFLELALEDMTSQDRSFDLIVAIDCIHDFANPVQGLQHIKQLLSQNGQVFWSEPTGSHNPIENRNPTGKMPANLSPFHCLSVSLAKDGAGLGTIIGEEGAKKLAKEAGFTNFEKIALNNKMQQFFTLRH